MIVYQIGVTTVDDYVTRREPHRRAHIARLQGLRANGILIGAGPSPDGTTADIVYRLQRPEQIQHAMEEDPYWTAGVWTRYTPRSFMQFVEPWELVPVVLDGTRRVTIVEGPVSDLDMAQLAIVEMRGAGRVHFGGFFPDGGTWALATSSDADEALGWFRATGFWKPDALTARPLLHVL